MSSKHQAYTSPTAYAKNSVSALTPSLFSPTTSAGAPTISRAQQRTAKIATSHVRVMTRKLAAEPTSTATSDSTFHLRAPKAHHHPPPRNLRLVPYHFITSLSLPAHSCTAHTTPCHMLSNTTLYVSALQHPSRLVGTKFDTSNHRHQPP